MQGLSVSPSVTSALVELSSRKRDSFIHQSAFETRALLSLNEIAFGPIATEA